MPDVPSNFISFYSGISKAILTNFSVADSTITNNCHFFSVSTTGGFAPLPLITVTNGTFKNLYEAIDENSSSKDDSSSQKAGVALMFDISGTLSVIMDTLTIENVLFSRKYLFWSLLIFVKVRHS